MSHHGTEGSFDMMLEYAKTKPVMSQAIAPRFGLWLNSKHCDRAHPDNFLSPKDTENQEVDVPHSYLSSTLDSITRSGHTHMTPYTNTLPQTLITPNKPPSTISLTIEHPSSRIL